MLTFCTTLGRNLCVLKINRQLKLLETLAYTFIIDPGKCDLKSYFGWISYGKEEIAVRVSYSCFLYAPLKAYRIDKRRILRHPRRSGIRGKMGTH